MGLKESYEKRKAELLKDTSICKPNRDLFKEFFEFEEHKLKRVNGLSKIDEASYKTLYGYISRFMTVNKWFKNKAWKDITKNDIQEVYDDLEDGKILNVKGQPFKDKRSYYNKIFKSKPFKLAGHKDDLAREVLEYFTDAKDKEVRYIDEEGFRKLVSVVSKPEHLLLFWLAWDVGENVTALLKLEKKDFRRQMNKDTKSEEYLVNLPKPAIKRSRQSRSELTLYPETFRYIEIILERGKEIFVEDKKGKDSKKNRGKDGKYKKITGKRKFVPFEHNDKIFSFEKRQASKVFDSAVKKTGVRVIPTGEKPTWKDLRSGMACHLFTKGWRSDDINLRLGHKISSRELDVYVSYLAANKKMPKKQLFHSNLEEIQDDLDESVRREKLQGQRHERTNEELHNTQQELRALQDQVKLILKQQRIKV
tara:strand:+ start:106 stop:1371 length:1266 start_codon:yes stop_codon:yes gene_type:complete